MDPASTFIWFERLFWGFLIIAGIFVLIAVLSPNNRQTYLKGAISFFVLAIISIAIMKLISLGDLSY
jgi:Sec-independent protein secretion pathway component TatC